MSDEPSAPLSITRARRAIADREAHQAVETARAHTFNRVTLLVIGTFCGLLVLLTLGTMIAGYLGLVPWKEAFGSISELLKIVLLPVTTLALGHYISRHK